MRTNSHSSDSKPRILLVDDEAKPRGDIAALLRASGYDVEEASTPESAAEMFLNRPFDFDVVLTDLDFRNSARDGSWLMREIIDIRSNRGYDLAPEIICLTGKIIDPNVANEIRQSGGQYLLKGLAKSYLLEVNAAIARISKFRNAGPSILFVHGAAQSSSYPVLRPRGRACTVGESISHAMILHGRRPTIPLKPTPLRLLDFFAYRAARHPIRLEEAANAYALDEFYSYWAGKNREAGISSDNIKTNVDRIRVALTEGLRNAGLNVNGNDVLVSEVFNDDEGYAFEAYKLRARCLLTHES